ncbi:UvrD-helicase domain-containing protein [Singulisphaera acidiphila]|uniref:DNA 3'-5' helicase n=1 Tax=Singulisphaera acidiphila (strain ATCC BAA-1392 / DSM 18658 / VKM B-2454 / MOB10) TaxID=886293 RepID=L0DMH1_SINAD|nr:UvrD-helicase domain-containing protein [Singulisphaera acidiphila]AGA30043.1 ATP-dependent exonuclase V beta subunit, helicase and exonuclease domain-containing [Singulisphaera acidiphila DSM 18658]
MSASDPRLSRQQASPLAVEGASVALSAGAGCGKTTVLTARFLGDLEGPAARSLSSIVALTFTEKAARELRQRIRHQCREKIAAGDHPVHWRAILRGLEAAPIGTFHEYCGHWLRRHALEAGIDPDFVILDAAVAGSIRDEALAKCLRQWLAAQDPDLIELAVEYGLGRVRQGIADLLVESSSGLLGEWQDRLPAEVVAIWQDVWSREGRPLLAQKMTQAVKPCLETLSHYESTHPLMRERRAFLLEHLPNLEANLDREEWLLAIREHAMVRGAGSKVHWPSPEIHEIVTANFKAVRDAIDKYFDKCQWDESATLEAAEQGLRLARLALRARQAYNLAKRSRGGLDFDDLLTMTLDLLRKVPEGHRPDSSTDLAIERLLVDEFQDTDPIQSEILERLAAPESLTGRLFLVGDFKQSIYRFRGAQPEIFQDFRDRFPVAGRHALTENFRSVPEILHFVNALFASTFPGPETALNPRVAGVGRPDQPAIEFIWATETEVSPSAGPKPSAHDRRVLEARWLARRLRQRMEAGWKVRDRGTGEIRDAHPGDLALLFRAMTDVGPYEAALDEEGFDYHTVGGAAFYVQQEVTDLINVLSVLEDPFDQVALAGTLRSPFFCLSDNGLFWLTTSRLDLVEGLEDADQIDELPDLDRQQARRARDMLARWRDFKDQEPIATLLNRILDESGYEAALLGESLGVRKRANARKLVRMARRFDQQRGMTLAAFVARLRADLKRPPREEQAATTDEEGNSIRLMSIHQAKGLEFPIVVLPDLNRRPAGRLDSTAFHPVLGPLVRPSREPGSVPTASTESDVDANSRQSLGWLTYQTLEQRADEDESLRLFYVATTRARDALILSSALSPADKATSPAMSLLDERFDRETGKCRVQLPAGWSVPAIRVTTERPPASGEPKKGGPWPFPLIETAEVIEQAEEVVEPPAVLIEHRPRFIELDPGLGSEAATSKARLNRLTRIALADPGWRRTREPAKFVARVVGRHDPLLPSRLFNQLVGRLETWSRGPIAKALAEAEVVREDIDWSIAWPPARTDASVFHGKIDVLFRDRTGAAQIVNVGAPGGSAGRDRLSLLLAMHTADAMGLGPIRLGWQWSTGEEERWRSEADFDPTSIDLAIRTFFNEGSGG